MATCFYVYGILPAHKKTNDRRLTFLASADNFRDHVKALAEAGNNGYVDVVSRKTMLPFGSARNDKRGAVIGRGV